MLLLELRQLDLKPCALVRGGVQRLARVRELGLVQAAHAPDLPARVLLLLLQQQLHGALVVLQLPHPLDVVGQAVVELLQVLFLLQTRYTRRADAGRRRAAPPGGAHGGGAAVHRCGGDQGHRFTTKTNR